MGNMRLSEKARGVFVIAATPFADDGSLDIGSIEQLMNFYLNCSVDGLTILGMMGEAPKLSPEESSVFLRAVLANIRGRIPVIVGVSSPGLRSMATLAHE